MDLDEIRLYIDVIYVGAVQTVLYNGTNSTFAYGTDGTQNWIDIKGLASPLPAVGSVASLSIEVRLIAASALPRGRGSAGVSEVHLWGLHRVWMGKLPFPRTRVQTASLPFLTLPPSLLL